ncbi:MAG: S-layer homology domain-containing protein [Firmicutes bacterium]|nr:S-layer homology domain-containing protein [Bacillota bacterium]
MSVLSKRLFTAVSIVLVVALTASVAIAAPAVVTDVPKDHWAYEAVTLLVNKGYMGVYESGQFRGDDNVSRYLLAFVAARLLRDVESGRTTLTDDDMRVVRELSVNLREQLAVVTGRLAQLEKAAADAASDAAIAREDVARGAASTKALQDELAAKTAAIDEQLKKIKDDATARASASDQKLTALWADSKQQMAAGDEAVRQEVAQQLAVVSAKVDSAQTSALGAVEGEAKSRRDLESRLSLSMDGLRLADEAQKAQIGQLSLRLDEALATIASNRAWAEAAIASNRTWAEKAIADEAARAHALHAELAAKAAAIEEQLKQVKDDTTARAGASDQKLTALHADSKQQIAAGDEAIRLEVAQQLAAVSAKADSAQASALAAVEGEAKFRRDLESRLSLSIDGLILADEAQKAQIGQLSLKLDDAVAAIALARAWAEAAIASNRAWAEKAIADEVAARQSAVASLQSAQDGFAESIRKSLDSGLQTERAAREKDLADLRTDLASLTAIQDDMAQSSALALGAAIQAEQRDRAASDDELRLSLNQLGGRVTALEEALTLRISGDISQVNAAIGAERAAREKDVAGLAEAVDGLTSAHGELAAATKDALSQAADALSAMVDAERSARQEEARRMLADLADARGEIADLDRKTAQADAAIMVGLETERARIEAVGAELRALSQAVAELEQYAQTIEGSLKELGKKQGSDYNQQRQALMDLQVAMDKLSKTLNDKIAANAAEDLRTGAKVVENAMDIRKVVDALNETRQALNANAASTKEAHTAIAEVNTAVEGLNKRLASMELMLQGSVDELRKRFADDLVAERWEAEAREVRLQSMIEELQARVDRLEGQKASQPTGTMSSGAIIGVLAVVAAIVAAIALSSGGSGN